MLRREWNIGLSASFPNICTLSNFHVSCLYVMVLCWIMLIRHEHIPSFLRIYTCANHITDHLSVFCAYLYSVNVHACSFNINSKDQTMTFPMANLRCCVSTKSDLCRIFHIFLQIFSVNMAYRESVKFQIPNIMIIFKNLSM